MREAERAEVVVVGNIGIDTCVYLYGDDIDWSVEVNVTENIDCIGQVGGYASRSYAVCREVMTGARLVHVSIPS